MYWLWVYFGLIDIKWVKIKEDLMIISLVFVVNSSYLILQIHVEGTELLYEAVSLQTIHLHPA